MRSQTFSHNLHPNFLCFLLLLRPNCSVLKSPLEMTGALFSTDELAFDLFLDGGVSTVGFGDFGGVSDVSLMFLVDLLKGITGGGFAVNLSALIRAELGSRFGLMLLHFLATGLLSSSLLTLSSSL